MPKRVIESRGLGREEKYNTSRPSRMAVHIDEKAENVNRFPADAIYGSNGRSLAIHSFVRLINEKALELAL